MADSQVLMEIGFNVLYLIFICMIVMVMLIRLRIVPREMHAPAKFILFAFAFLMIGDIGHVGARLIVFVSGPSEQGSAIIGIGGLMENVGLTFLFLFWTEAWRLLYNKSRDLLYWCLIAIGILGLVIYTFPQNQWAASESPYEWMVIRNLAWFIQGLVLSILILIEARKAKQKLMRRIGFSILISYLRYMPVIFFGRALPILGMLMIPATMFYMIWEFSALRFFFPKA